jgi:cell division protein FtsZ
MSTTRPKKTGAAAAEEKKSHAPQKYRVKLLGIGGAGCNILKHIGGRSDLLTGAVVIVIDTDARSLAGIDAEKIQIGSSVTHGLGAGGDVELGARAAQQDAERIEAVAQNTDIIFLAAGLGGGTGGGAAPVIARLAKSQGALVLTFVAMPFSFEGERRRQQALASLEQLKTQADAVICVPNDKLFKLMGENASVVDAFKRGNELIVTGAQAIWQLLSREGLINLNFADLRAALAAKHCEGIFSCGDGHGPDKARDAVKALMESPLLDGSETLARAEGMLISILGGPDLTLADVQRAVEPISRVATRAQIIMGAAVDEQFKGKLSITLIASTNAATGRVAQPTQSRFPIARTASIIRAPATPAATPAPPLPSSAAQAVATRKAVSAPKQETLPLEGASRGRFDKSEPTLYEGEDLDIPTFLRRGVSLKR